jgi:hypothetical protein
MAGVNAMAVSAARINAMGCPDSCKQAVGGDSIGFVVQIIHRLHLQVFNAHLSSPIAPAVLAVIKVNPTIPINPIHRAANGAGASTTPMTLWDKT